MPSYTQFNSSAIADVWQQCLLFAVQPTAAGAAPALNFQMVGDKLNALYGNSMIGRTFNPQQRSFQGAAIVSKVSTVLSNPAPLVDTGQFVSEKGKVIKYRSCLLPFGRQGVVTHVVAGLSWREF